MKITDIQLVGSPRDPHGYVWFDDGLRVIFDCGVVCSFSRSDMISVQHYRLAKIKLSRKFPDYIWTSECV